MVTAPFLAWCVVAVGIVTAFALGWRVGPGVARLVGALLADGLIGLALSMVLYLAVLLCAGSGLCRPTDGETVWSLVYPAMAVPLYWLATLLGRLAGVLTAPSDANPS